MTDQKNTTRVHLWKIGTEQFELDARFRVSDYLGAGGYLAGLCWTVAKRTLREMRLLSILKNDNVVRLVNILAPQDPHGFSDVYLVFELMQSDLASVIKSSVKITEDQIQMMCGLQYIHSCGIIHRDLKPRNILVNSSNELKLADFGLARLYSKEDDTTVAPMTEYVTTRWYRAPEILVGWAKYTEAVDNWAAGAIVAELHQRRPMLPGIDSVHQIDLIVRMFGKSISFSSAESNLSGDVTYHIVCSSQFLHRNMLREAPENQPEDLSVLLPSASPAAIHLILSLMQYDPSHRLCASEALDHTFLCGMKKFADNSWASCAIADFSFEKFKSTTESLRMEILREVLKYNAEFVLPDDLLTGFVRLDPCESPGNGCINVFEGTNSAKDERHISSGVSAQIYGRGTTKANEYSAEQNNGDVAPNTMLSSFTSLLDNLSAGSESVYSTKPPLYPSRAHSLPDIDIDAEKENSLKPPRSVGLSASVGNAADSGLAYKKPLVNSGRNESKRKDHGDRLSIRQSRKRSNSLPAVQLIGNEDVENESKNLNSVNTRPASVHVTEEYVKNHLVQQIWIKDNNLNDLQIGALSSTSISADMEVSKNFSETVLIGNILDFSSSLKIENEVSDKVMKENSQIVFQTINYQVESSVHIPASNPVDKDKDNELRNPNPCIVS